MPQIGKFSALITLICLAAYYASAPLAMAQDTGLNSANVLVYHRFGENAFPSTNVRLEQFEQHLKSLKQGGYNFPTIPELLGRLERGLPPIDRSVIITVDDAYLSVFTEAWPRLKKMGIPLAVFVSSDESDTPGNVYMSWAQLRQLKKEGVYIGHHGASHSSLITLDINEARADINAATARFKKELGAAPDVFAWPYGEYSEELENLLKDMGFRAAFSQTSGALGVESNRFALPRFAINERYGQKDRFDLVLDAAAMPVKDVLPTSPIIGPQNPNPPIFGFSLTRPLANLGALNCYPSNSTNPASINIVGDTRVEVRFDAPFPVGRGRVNCTLPAGNGRWYWLGMPFFITEN